MCFDHPNKFVGLFPGSRRERKRERERERERERQRQRQRQRQRDRETETERGNVMLVGALIPVNHRGLHQG